MIATATTARTVEDVEELDALALNRARPLDRVLLVDRVGIPLTAYPDLRTEQVRVVRQPTLSEAVQLADGARSEVIEQWEPLTFRSDRLEQWRFPMTVLDTRPAAIIPTDLETDLAA